MMMTMYSLHSTPPHSPCHHLLTTAAPQMSRWLSCGRCWLLSDRYHIGCHNEQKYPPITILPNICEYCPVPNNPNTGVVLNLKQGWTWWTSSTRRSMQMTVCLRSITICCKPFANGNGWRQSFPDIIRVRTTLTFGYWVLGNICRYWVVLLLGDISVQTAVSTVHMIIILMSVVRPLSADDGRESGAGVECKLYIIIIQFWDFTWYSVVYILLQNQYIAMLHSSIIGYWVPCLVSF